MHRPVRPLLTLRCRPPLEKLCPAPARSHSAVVKLPRSLARYQRYRCRHGRLRRPRRARAPADRAVGLILCLSSGRPPPRLPEAKACCCSTGITGASPVMTGSRLLNFAPTGTSPAMTVECRRTYRANAPNSYAIALDHSPAPAGLITVNSAKIARICPLSSRRTVGPRPFFDRSLAHPADRFRTSARVPGPSRCRA